jgi:hypothetical protein
MNADRFYVRSGFACARAFGREEWICFSFFPHLKVWAFFCRRAERD